MFKSACCGMWVPSVTPLEHWQSDCHSSEPGSVVLQGRVRDWYPGDASLSSGGVTAPAPRCNWCQKSGGYPENIGGTHLNVGEAHGCTSRRQRQRDRVASVQLRVSSVCHSNEPYTFCIAVSAYDTPERGVLGRAGWLAQLSLRIIACCIKYTVHTHFTFYTHGCKLDVAVKTFFFCSKSVMGRK